MIYDGSIGDLFTVQPKEIVDVIDARFKLTDDGLNDLATTVGWEQEKLKPITTDRRKLSGQIVLQVR